MSKLEQFSHTPVIGHKEDKDHVGKSGCPSLEKGGVVKGVKDVIWGDLCGELEG